MESRLPGLLSDSPLKRLHAAQELDGGGDGESCPSTMGLQFAVAEAIYEVVVHHSGGLHEGIRGGRPHEAEAALL